MDQGGKPQEIAEDLMRFSGRLVRQPQDHNELMRHMDDRRATQIAVQGALGGDEPDWWIRLGDSEWMLVGLGDGAAVARSLEPGVLEFERLGTLAGGRHSEQWTAEKGEVTFTHDRLPAPAIVSVTLDTRDPDARSACAAFRRWAAQQRR